ncbi:MAG: propanediol utilization microcompartment protein PduB [Streptococcaceae bacterium]|jgi:microcompartment protein PduB|nr:propanediol utilization microcompartment protein PduB [Streptococcaceae bacterium]
MPAENITIDKIMKKVMAQLASSTAVEQKKENKQMAIQSSLTEFVGTSTIGDTIGLVIANVDSQLSDVMHLNKEVRSIGIIGSRTGASPQIFAADEAVKATNTEIVSVELPCDTKGGGGHGVLIVFGGKDVSDVRRAVEITLKETERCFGDIYANEAGDVEFNYTARASHALVKAFGAEEGKAFGLIAGCPSAIGVVMADTAVKAANVEVVGFASPAKGQNFSNEVTLNIKGDSGAVRQSVIAAREIGIQMLATLGSEPKNQFPSYI